MLTGHVFEEMITIVPGLGLSLANAPHILHFFSKTVRLCGL